MVSLYGYCAIDNCPGSLKDRIFQWVKNEYNSNISTPNLKIFVVGYPLAGKSTLIKAIQDKIGRTAFNDFVVRFRRLRVSGVELNTAGIIPITIQLGNSGQVTFYDFAGQAEYYSSHAAMLKNLISLPGNIILIVTNLNKDTDEVSSALKYWCSFISNLEADEQIKSSKLILFTHIDELSSTPASKIEELKDRTDNIIDTEILNSSISLNCTRASSSGLDNLFDIIMEKCTQFQNQSQLDLCVCFIFGFLHFSFKGSVALKLNSLIDSLKTQEIVLDEVSLLNVLHALNKQGKILFLFDSNDINSSWIILETKVLLEEVNGTIFSPENFSQHYRLSYSYTGVVPLSRIAEIFNKNNYDARMIVDFLSYFEFCHEIRKTEADLIRKKTRVEGEKDDESLYFFPALVEKERPQGQIMTDEKLKFCWYLACNVASDDLFPRFLHVLLLHLAFSLSPDPEEEDPPPSCPVMQMECNVWKNGIHWKNGKGQEAVVEVVDYMSAVVVMVGCMKDTELDGVRLRSEIIKTVLEVKEEHSKVITTTESIISPGELKSYPLGRINQLQSFPMYALSRAISKNDNFVIHKQDSANINQKSIKELLYFEPYACLNKAILTELFDDSNSDSEVSENFLSDIARCAYPYKHFFEGILPHNVSELAAAIAQDPSNCDNNPHQCFLLLRTWMMCCPTQPVTFCALRDALDKYSVFAGRNPLKSESPS